MTLTDKLIDVILALLLVGAIVAIVRFGGYGISQMITKIKKMIFGGKYPIQSSSFPFDHLKFGNLVEIKDVGTCKFLGKRDGKYYIETTTSTASFDGEPYYYADKSFIEQNATKLMSSNGIKWEKQ